MDVVIKYTIEQLPAVDGRVETGPIQFGDDWPGVFIRGDNAFHYAQLLKALIDMADKQAAPGDNFFVFPVVRGLQELLESCVLEQTGYGE